MFKLGDKVRLKKNRIVNDTSFVEEMRIYENKILTVDRLCLDFKDRFYIKEDNREFFWLFEWFIPAKIEKLKYSDFLKLNSKT